MQLFTSLQVEDYMLSYHLVEGGKANMYGICVKSESSSGTKTAFCYNVSPEREEAVKLLELVAANSVFPSNINDVVEDWMQP